LAFFKGQEIFSLDAKGRVNVPAKMRKSISPEAGDTFTVTRGKDSCIEAYPMDEWRLHEARYRELDQSNPKNRYLLRMALMWSEEVSFDASQRIKLPNKLLEHAGIEKKVLIVGVGDHIEFWNPDKYEEYLAAFDESYEDVVAEVMNSKPDQ
jgi:MraZ protein